MRRTTRYSIDALSIRQRNYAANVSKVYGLAGVRIGYGFAHEELIRNPLKVKLPFELFSAGAGRRDCCSCGLWFLHRSLLLNLWAVRYLTSGLEGIGLSVAPLHARFVMAVLPDEQEARRVFEELLTQGVVVQPLKATGLPNCLRISDRHR